MVTLESVPGPVEYLGLWSAKLIQRRTRAHSSTRDSSLGRTQALFISMVKATMTLAGFGCLTYAGFCWNMRAGLIIAGISFFVLSWLITNRSDDSSSNTGTTDPILKLRPPR